MFNFSIFKIEFKTYLRSALIWSISFGLFALINLLFFNGIKENTKSLMDVFGAYPQDILQAFAIDLNTMGKIEGYFNGQFLNIFLIVNSIYALYLGSAMIGREMSSKTIAYLLTKPVKRSEVFLSKYFGVALDLFVCNFLVGLLSYVSVYLFTNERGNFTMYFVLSFAMAYLLQLLFLTIGTIFGILWKNSPGFLYGIGLVMLLYVLDFLTKLKNFPKWPSDFDPFHYVDLAKLASSHSTDIVNVIFFIGLSIIFLIAGIILFYKRDFDI